MTKALLKVFQSDVQRFIWQWKTKCKRLTIHQSIQISCVRIRRVVFLCFASRGKFTWSRCGGETNNKFINQYGTGLLLNFFLFFFFTNKFFTTKRTCTPTSCYGASLWVDRNLLLCCEWSCFLTMWFDGFYLPVSFLCWNYY